MTNQLQSEQAGPELRRRPLRDRDEEGSCPCSPSVRTYARRRCFTDTAGSARSRLDWQALFADDAIVLHDQANERPGRRASRQDRPATRETISRCAGESPPARDRASRSHWAAPSLLRCLVALISFRCTRAVANHRELISSCPWRIALISSRRAALLARPEQAGSRIDRAIPCVPHAERVNLGMRVRAARRRIVLRDRAVGIDAQHLAYVAVELLRLRPVRTR